MNIVFDHRRAVQRQQLLRAYYSFPFPFSKDRLNESKPCFCLLVLLICWVLFRSPRPLSPPRCPSEAGSERIHSSDILKRLIHCVYAHACTGADAWGRAATQQVQGRQRRGRHVIVVRYKQRENCTIRVQQAEKGGGGGEIYGGVLICNWYRQGSF